MTDHSETRISLSAEPVINRRGKERQRGRKFSPVLHVLLPDGTSETFRSRPVVVHDTNGGEPEPIYALLMTRDGVPFVDTTGRPIVLPVPPMSFTATEPDDKRLSWQEVAERAGVSLSSVRRAVDAGALPKPKKIGPRRVLFALGDVREWITKVGRG